LQLSLNHFSLQSLIPRLGAFAAISTSAVLIYAVLGSISDSRLRPVHIEKPTLSWLNGIQFGLDTAPDNKAPALQNTEVPVAKKFKVEKFAKAVQYKKKNVSHHALAKPISSDSIKRVIASVEAAEFAQPQVEVRDPLVVYQTLTAHLRERFIASVTSSDLDTQVAQVNNQSVLGELASGNDNDDEAFAATAAIAKESFDKAPRHQEVRREFIPAPLLKKTIAEEPHVSSLAVATQETSKKAVFEVVPVKMNTQNVAQEPKKVATLDVALATQTPLVTVPKSGQSVPLSSLFQAPAVVSPLLAQNESVHVDSHEGKSAPAGSDYSPTIQLLGSSIVKPTTVVQAPMTSVIPTVTQKTTQPAKKIIQSGMQNGGALVGGNPSHKAAPLYPEAFQWDSEVSAAARNLFTQEKPGAQVGWAIADAADHLPSLGWQNTEEDSLPLISLNSARMLAALGSVSLESQAGIIFGKVPSGWNLDFSGRAEKPIFLTRTNQVSNSSTAVDEERYFAFLNAAPGAHLLYLSSANGTQTGAVGVPVLRGTSTYVDFTHFTTVQVSGRVVDGKFAEPHGMKDISVRVVGQPNAVAVTHASGRFELNGVWTLEGYPIYLETDGASGYVQRQRVFAGESTQLLLFRLEKGQVEDWVSQLEGGISAESGIVLAALPSLVSKNSDLKLWPTVRPVQPNSTLVPETYTLSTSGQLQVNDSLDVDSSRFLSVQVPEGANIAEIKDHNGRLIWSELVVASPGVVSLIGPY
jgi:hypothetical protein